jgi:hypothetical protein
MYGPSKEERKLVGPSAVDAISYYYFIPLIYLLVGNDKGETADKGTRQWCGVSNDFFDLVMMIMMMTVLLL